MTKTTIMVGFGQADITPPRGLGMCGGLTPRPNEGIADPLLAKALVVATRNQRIAIVGVDIIGLPRSIVDPAIAEAARRTGIAPEAIIVSCSHTHSGPYTTDNLYASGVTDAAYLASLPDRIATSIEEGERSLQPATMAIGRSLVYHGLHHRRVLCKDGKAINTWLPDVLNDLERCPQIIGTAGPVDPELWVVRFDDPLGKALGFLWNFSMHVNTRWGNRWSADYPAVVAEEMKRAFGAHVHSVFTPGACANINTTFFHNVTQWHKTAKFLATAAIDAARRARPVSSPIVVDAVRCDLLVSRRKRESQPPDALQRLGWEGSTANLFGSLADWIESTPAQWQTPVSAMRIGPLGIATNPGELFVEHGLSIKRRSPFPHTIVTELTNDLILYEPTREAMTQGGYETLIGANRIDIDGIEKLVDTAVDLLQNLWERS